MPGQADIGEITHPDIGIIRIEKHGAFYIIKGQD